MSERFLGLEGPILVMDIQATGPRPEVDHLLEIAAAWCDPTSGRVAEFSRRCRLPAGREVPRRVANLTGLCARELAGEPEPEQVWRELGAWLQMRPRGRVLVVHYLPFERRFLEHWSGLLPTGVLPDVYECTWELSRVRFPELPAHSLRAVAGYVGYVLDQRRCALEHVRATLAVWQRCRGLGVPEAAEDERQSAGDTEFRRTRYPADPAGGTPAWAELPRGPGIYRLLDASGRVLYVGKAADLRSRVRSYFGPEGSRRRGGRIREMVAQVKGVEIVRTPSRLEAALLEFEEIQVHDPPYNRIHRHRAERHLWFGERSLHHWRTLCGSEFPVGPIASPRTLQAAAELWEWIRGAGRAPEWPAATSGKEGKDGPEENGEDVLARLREWARDRFRPWLVLSHPLVALLGLRSCALEALAEAVSPDEVTDDEQEDGTQGRGRQAAEAPEAEAEFRALQRDLLHALARGAEEVRRSRWFRRLADAAISWRSDQGPPRYLVLQGGRVVLQGKGPWRAPSPADHGTVPPGWETEKGAALEETAWDETAWRRCTTLTAELRRLVREGAAVEACFPGGLRWEREHLARLLGGAGAAAWKRADE